MEDKVSVLIYFVKSDPITGPVKYLRPLYFYPRFFVGYAITPDDTILFYLNSTEFITPYNEETLALFDSFDRSKVNLN
jgi:hypothetical protein